MITAVIGGQDQSQGKDKVTQGGPKVSPTPSIFHYQFIMLILYEFLQMSFYKCHFTNVILQMSFYKCHFTVVMFFSH